MLHIHNLTLTHVKDLRVLVNGLNISIEKGDKVAIIGEEGNGKSSLLKTLFQAPNQPNYLLLEGEITRSYSSYGYLSQGLSEDIAGLTLENYFFGQVETDLDYGLVYRNAKQLAFDSERLTSNQQIASLSGGERLKVQLIKLLSLDKDILFLDEPSNDLDIQTLIWLENFIRTSKKTIVFVSHDELFLSKTANKIIHLESVKKKTVAQTTVETSNYHSYREKREATYQKQVLKARNEQKEFDKAMTKHLRQKSQVRTTLLNTHDATAGRLIAKKMKSVLAREKRYEKTKEGLTQFPYHEDCIELSFKNIAPLPASKQIVYFDQYPLHIKSNNQILSSITLSMRARDRIGIIGKNGIGKSTLLKMIYKYLQEQKELSLGYLPQDYQEILDGEKSPYAFLTNTKNIQTHQDVLTHLANLQFTRQEVHHPIKNLSGGQQAKVLLVKILIDQANILLLDEPSRNFSPTSQPHIRQLFSDFRGGIICVSHDRAFLRQVCDTFYHLTSQGLIPIDSQDLFENTPL